MILAGATEAKGIAEGRQRSRLPARCHEALERPPCPAKPEAAAGPIGDAAFRRVAPLRPDPGHRRFFVLSEAVFGIEQKA